MRRDPPAMVARCAAGGRRAARVPATRSPMPCAPRRGATRCPARCCSSTIEARSLELAGEAMADDAALQAYLWKSEGAAVRFGRAHPGSRSRVRPSRRLRRRAARPTAWRGCCSACRATLSRGRLLLPQSRLEAAGVTRSELLAGERRAQRCQLACRACATRSARSLVTSRQHVANLPREARAAFLPLALVRSYLRALERRGRDRLARIRRDCAAHARAEDRDGALARPHLMSAGRASGSSREQPDADRCRPKPVAWPCSDGRCAHCLHAAAELRIDWHVENAFRFFLDRGRYARAPRDLGEPVGGRAPPVPCRRPSGCSASAIPTAGPP